MQIKHGSTEDEQHAITKPILRTVVRRIGSETDRNVFSWANRGPSLANHDRIERRHTSLNPAVRPKDKHLLEMGFAHVSDQARYFRFLRLIAKLSDKDLDYLTSIHGPDRALDLTTEPLPIGVGRYVRLPAEPAAAEVAVSVVDSHQGRGLGSLLIGALAVSAMMNGLQALVALVHASNAPMLRLFKEPDATIVMVGGTERELRIPLYRDPAHYPGTLVGDAVRRAYALCKSSQS